MCQNLKTSKATKTSLPIVPESSKQSVRPILQMFLCYERLVLLSFSRSELCFDLRKTSKRFNAKNVCAPSKLAQHGIEIVLAIQLSRGNGLTDFVQWMCCWQCWELVRPSMWSRQLDFLLGSIRGYALTVNVTGVITRGLKWLECSIPFACRWYCKAKRWASWWGECGSNLARPESDYSSCRMAITMQQQHTPGTTTCLD